MEATVLGLVLGSSILITAERSGLRTPEAIKRVRQSVGDIEIVISSMTIAELGHATYRTESTQRSQERRQFLDELKAQVPVHSITATTAEIIAKIGGQQAARESVSHWQISS
jgi:predicted nucleic acid-binding protein